MNKKVALIACSNGFGHTRRLLCFAEIFIAKGYEVTLFAPAHKAKKLIRVLDLTLYPKIIDFELDYSISKWCSSEFTDLSCLPKLDNFDIVISDNILDVLSVRPDAYISASFFWHKTFDGVPQAKVRHYDDLILRSQPTIFASKYFAQDYINILPNVFYTGLINPLRFSPPQYLSPQFNLLISCGGGGEAGLLLSDFLTNIEFDFKPNQTLFIEPKYYSSNMPSFIQPASYTSQMYQSCKYAIIRPGVGTITDCLVHNVVPLFFYESYNNEIKHNAAQLHRMRLGEDCITIEKCWEKYIQLEADINHSSVYTSIAQSDFNSLELVFDHVSNP